MAEQTQNDAWSKVEQVNALLLAGEPYNISEDTYGGYTGYDPQAIKNAMNKVFGIGKWGCKELSSEIVDGGGLVVAKVEIWLDGVEWRPESWGQNRITKGDVGDARKGAKTDAMKKALSDFSIGDRAYLGLLPKPPKENRQGDQRQTSANNNQRAASGQTNNGARTSANNRQPSAPVGTAPRSATPTSAPRPAAPAPSSNAPRQTPPPAPADDPDLNQIPSSGKLRARVDNGTYRGDDGKPLEWKNVLAAVFAPEINAQRTTVDKLLKAEMGPQSCKRVYDYLERLNAA